MCTIEFHIVLLNNSNPLAISLKSSKIRPNSFTVPCKNSLVYRNQLTAMIIGESDAMLSLFQAFDGALGVVWM